MINAREIEFWKVYQEGILRISRIDHYELNVYFYAPFVFMNRFSTTTQISFHTYIMKRG